MATDAGCQAQADTACAHAAAATCFLDSSQPPHPSAAAAAPVQSHAEQQEMQAADTATGAPQAAGPVQACPKPEPSKSSALCRKRQRAELSLYEELLLEHTKSKLRQRRGSTQEAAPPVAPHAQPLSSKDELKQPKRGQGVQAKQGKPQQQAKHSKLQQQAKQRKLQQQAKPLSDSEAGGVQQQQQQQGEPSLLDVLWREHTLSKLRHNRAPAPHAAKKQQAPAKRPGQAWSTTSAAESSDDPDDDVDTTDSDTYTAASPRKNRQRPQQKQQPRTQQRQQQQQEQPLLLDVLWREHTLSKLRRNRRAVQSGNGHDAAALRPAQPASALSAEASTSGVGHASNSTAACKQKVAKRQGQQQEQGQQATEEGSLLDELWRAQMLGKLRHNRAPSQHSADTEQPGQATSAATDTTTTTEASSYDAFDDSDTADSDSSAPTSPRKTKHKRLKQPRAQRQQQQRQQKQPSLQQQQQQRQQKQPSLQLQQQRQQKQPSLQQQQQDQQQPEQSQAQHDRPPDAPQQPQQPCQAEPTLYEVMWREHMLSKLRRHKSGLTETKPKAKRAPDGRKRSADCPAWSKQGLEVAVGQGAAMLGLRGVVPVGGRTGSRLRWSACAEAGEEQGAAAAELQEMQTGTQQDEQQQQQQQQQQEALQQNEAETQTLQEQQEQLLQQKEAKFQPVQQTEQQVKQQHPRTQLLPACQQQTEVGVLVLLHESGWPNAAVWEHYEALHGGRLVVKVHLKAGVEVAEGLEGWSNIQSRRLRTAVKAEWGDLSLTEAMLDSLGEMLQAYPTLQHLAVVSGHDLPVSLIPRGLLPPGCSLFGDFKFGAEFTEAARGLVVETLQQQLGMEEGEARGWGQALVLHHTWVVLCRDLILALLSRKDELLRIGAPLNARFMQPDVALAADEFLLLTAAVRWGFVRSIHRSRLRVVPAKRGAWSAAAAAAADGRGGSGGAADDASAAAIAAGHAQAAPAVVAAVAAGLTGSESDSGCGAMGVADTAEPGGCFVEAANAAGIPTAAAARLIDAVTESSDTTVHTAATPAAEAVELATAVPGVAGTIVVPVVPASAVAAADHAAAIAPGVSGSGGSVGVSGSGDEGSCGVQAQRRRRRGPKLPPQPAAGALLDTYPTLVLFHPEHNRHPHTWSSLDGKLPCDVRAGMPGITARLSQAHLSLHDALSLVPVNRPLWFRKVALSSSSDQAVMMTWLQALWAGKYPPAWQPAAVDRPAEAASVQGAAMALAAAAVVAPAAAQSILVVRCGSSSSCELQEAVAGPSADVADGSATDVGARAGAMKAMCEQRSTGCTELLHQQDVAGCIAEGVLATA